MQKQVLRSKCRVKCQSLNFKTSRVHCIRYSCQEVISTLSSFSADRHTNTTKNSSFFAQHGWCTHGLISTVSLYPQPRKVNVQQSVQRLTTTLECIIHLTNTQHC